MSKIVVRVDVTGLSDQEVDKTADLLEELGLAGEELSGSLGVLDDLAQMLVLSSDDLHSVFDSMLAAAGGVAAAKLAELVRTLPRRLGGRALSDRNHQAAVIIDDAALDDPRAMEALLHVDPGALAEGTVLVWDPATARWRRRTG